MRTIAQKKARIKGWIKEYKNRINLYKEKHPPYSRQLKVLLLNCNDKIKKWESELDKLGYKQDYTKLIQFILLKTNEYFLREVQWNGSRSININTNPEKYYLCRFIVELGVNGVYAQNVLGTTVRNIYEKREVCAKAEKHKNSYRAYKLTMEAELQANNIQYK